MKATHFSNDKNTVFSFFRQVAKKAKCRETNYL